MMKNQRLNFGLLLLFAVCALLIAQVRGDVSPLAPPVQTFPRGSAIGQALTWDGTFWVPGAGSGTVVADVDPVVAPPAEGMFGWNRVAKSLWIYDNSNGWVKLIGNP